MQETYHGRPVEAAAQSLREHGADHYTTTQAIQGGGYVRKSDGTVLNWVPFKVIDKLNIQRKKGWWE